jgi:hypothetical protein
VNKPAQPLSPFHSQRLGTRPTLDWWPTIWRRKFEAPMRSMDVVVIGEDRQSPLEMLGAENQQPV